MNKQTRIAHFGFMVTLKFCEITCDFVSLYHSLMAGEGTASSQRSFWRTTTLPSRTLNMKAGTWPSAERVGPSRLPKPGRTSGKFTSSSASTKDLFPSPTRTNPNTLSSSASLRPDGLNATEKPTLLPNTNTSTNSQTIFLLILRRGSFIFIYFRT